MGTSILIPHFSRLQDEYMQLQGELKATIEESKLVQEKYKQLLDQCRKELQNKHLECEELRTQVSFPDITKSGVDMGKRTFKKKTPPMIFYFHLSRLL